jgi:hypothetical protein
MRMKMDAIIVPCTQEKIWDTQPNAGAVAARDAYTHPAFHEWRRVAEESGQPWFIMSTTSGLLEPGQKIQKYNVPISRALADPDLRQLLGEQGRAMNLQRFDKLILLDWEKFQPLVRAAVRNLGVKCVRRRVRY